MRTNNRKHSDMTAKPEKYPNGSFRLKGCKICEKEFEPLAPSHLYCSDVCKDIAYSNNYYKRYGTNYKEVMLAKELQQDKCAICGGLGFKMHVGIKENLVVDHCHISKKLRGLLCNNCNRGLGLFKDNIEFLSNAIEYLKRNKIE